MRGSKGWWGGGGGPVLPWNLQSLISPILLEMKKSVIFHICALPQLYVKVGAPPPGKFFWIRACMVSGYVGYMCLSSSETINNIQTNHSTETDFKE